MKPIVNELYFYECVGQWWYNLRSGRGSKTMSRHGPFKIKALAQKDSLIYVQG
jgi:hypothetical protein